MPDVQPPPISRIVPRLEDGEPVWAVYTGAVLALLITPRRLFIEEQGRVASHPLDEFAGVRRVSESLVVLERRSGPSIRIPTDPRDEQGLQALTVIGLLVALGGRPGAILAKHGPGAPGDPAAPGRLRAVGPPRVHRPAGRDRSRSLRPRPAPP